MGWAPMRAITSVSQASGLDAVEFCGPDQGVERGGALAAGIGARKQPVFPAQSHGPDLALGSISSRPAN